MHSDEELRKMVEEAVPQNFSGEIISRLYFCTASDGRYVIATLRETEHGYHIEHHFLTPAQMYDFMLDILSVLNKKRN